jgi:hypothetical protein
MKDFPSPQAAQEGNKLHFDAFKHLTTLSTGAILILIALLEKLFVNPQWKILIGVSLVAFILSILSSVLMMFVFAETVAAGSPHGGRKEGCLVGFSVAFFMAGIIAFVAFALKNFYR